MNPARVMIVLIAAVSAIGLAVVMQHVLKGKVAPAPEVVAQTSGKAMTLVLVAKRDLAIGARLAAGDVAWQPWPSDAVNPAFITNGAAPVAANPTQSPSARQAAQAVALAAGDMIGGVSPEKAVEGAIVRDPILIGEPVTARKIVRGGEGGYLSVVLQPGKRAVAVPITTETAAGGFILPGDRVDVLQSHEGSGGGEGGPGKMIVAETVLRNVRVLALDQNTAAGKDAKAMVAATATLEVGAQDAEALTRAKAEGPVTLSLRAYTDLGAPSGAARPEDATLVRINRGGQTTSLAVGP